jgi:hypothetical protein
MRKKICKLRKKSPKPSLFPARHQAAPLFALTRIGYLSEIRCRRTSDAMVLARIMYSVVDTHAKHGKGQAPSDSTIHHAQR